MEMTLDADPRLYLIRSYSPDEIAIAENNFNQSLIVTGQRLVAPWHVDNLQVFRDLSVDVVLWGKGTTQEFPAPEIRQWFAQQKIALEAMTLGAACRTYNILVQEGRAVAAALILSTPV
jgi:uncharacterized protein